ncbi:hypothetical protein NDU88_002544 [Pleurodeles waltl]|uniref:Uncharacterized protein n=1 Tax=Pleurodeles waltl TaxID=8319 RepID=A0AAV7M0W4_PLEWA|nr:hypothetical protein NDU88_002544 [Pleurodeles waltl]
MIGCSPGPQLCAERCSGAQAELSGGDAGPTIAEPADDTAQQAHKARSSPAHCRDRPVGSDVGLLETHTGSTHKYLPDSPQLRTHVCGGAAAPQRFMGWAWRLADCGLPHRGQRKRATLLIPHAGEQKSLGEPGARTGLADEAGGHSMKPGRQ